jgi:D-threonine aldolase
MAILVTAHADVGGDVVSGGGTGTWDLNPWCTEIQAGSYMLMDTQYDELGLAVREGAVGARHRDLGQLQGRIIADCGLKALGMDHGNPSWDDGDVLFCSDEHLTLVPREPGAWSVGDRVRIWPAHVDPTVARHEQFWMVDGERIVDRWPIDLRHW